MGDIDNIKKPVLACIYNVFDGEENLEKSIKQIRHAADIVIAIVQITSNDGRTRHEGGANEVERLVNDGLIDSYCQYTVSRTSKKRSGAHETNKRNQGLNLARIMGATHYIMMDCDEFYEGNEFMNLWHVIRANPTIKATVCKMYTYFGLPTLRLANPENYYVPFICKLEPDSKVGNFNCGYYCDPTRKPNKKAIHIDKIMMHHYSYVRKNVGSLIRKIQASSAYPNLIAKENQLIKDWKDAAYHGRGVGLKPCIYDDSLIFTANHFDIKEPEIYEESQ